MRWWMYIMLRFAKTTGWHGGSDVWIYNSSRLEQMKNKPCLACKSVWKLHTTAILCIIHSSQRHSVNRDVRHNPFFGSQGPRSTGFMTTVSPDLHCAAAKRSRKRMRDFFSLGLTGQGQSVKRASIRWTHSIGTITNTHTHTWLHPRNMTCRS